MEIKKLILIMGILSSIFGCSQNNNLIELTSKQDAEEGWQDLIFSITKKQKLDNGFWSLTCKAKYENQIVGLKINIADGIPAGFVNEEIDNILADNKQFEDKINEFDAHFATQMKDLHKNLSEGVAHIQKSTESIRDLETINDQT